jgi:hypothetical protein
MVDILFYTSMYMGHWNLKPPQEGEWDRKESNGEDEPIWI